MKRAFLFTTLAVLALGVTATALATRIPCPRCNSLDTWCWYFHNNQDHASPAFWEDSCVSADGQLPPAGTSICPQCGTPDIQPDSARCHNCPSAWPPFWP